MLIPAWGTMGRPGSGPELIDNVTGGKFKDGALKVGGGIFAKVDEDVDDNFPTSMDSVMYLNRNSRLLTYEWCF